MKRFVFLVFLLMPMVAFGHSGRTNAQGCHNDRVHGGYHCHSGNSSSSTSTTPSYSSPSQTTRTVERDDDGRIKRSSSAKTAFKKQHPCPATGSSKGSCDGYVIDHITALACGGLDDPSNMQWQTVEQAKEKDKWERDGCDIRY